MSSYHLTVFLIKADSILILNQTKDLFSAYIIVYQQLIGKLTYLGYKTWPDIVFVIG